jgi:hypothetical protein
MTISRDQAVAIATANAPAGGYTDAQINEWADWAVSNPDVIYSPDPGAQMANAMVASQAAASQAAASQGNYEVAAAETPRSSYTPIDYNAPVFQPAPAGTVLERNPFFDTLQVREDVDYDVLYGAKSLEEGGTAPTPEAINAAFETFYNRPADVAGIQGYLQSGKSMEQINADLAYQSLYAPELTLAPNAQYYEAPSKGQLSYIQALGGGAPTFEREDTFTYEMPELLSEQEVRSLYTDRLGYEPTQQDIEYWTKVYAASPDVRYSKNPKMQQINALLAASNLPQYQYLKEGVNLTGTEGINYAGTPRSPAQISGEQYVDYGAAQTPGTPAPFGGYFEAGFNPFDYTGIAPTPLTYTGYDPTLVQYQSDLANLAQFNPPTAPGETPAGEDQGIAAVVPGTT